MMIKTDMQALALGMASNGREVGSWLAEWLAAPESSCGMDKDGDMYARDAWLDDEQVAEFVGWLEKQEGES